MRIHRPHVNGFVADLCVPTDSGERTQSHPDSLSNLPETVSGKKKVAFKNIRIRVDRA